MKSTIPVHILTGFLGSGKTTLLNKTLAASGFGADTAIIINEFGDIALDQLFIQEQSEETIVLKSGCICCSIRTDLVSTLMQLAAMSGARPKPLRRIIIETSGISDPVPILVTLRSDFNLLTRFHAGSTVCVVDATAGDARAEAMTQLAAADGCVIAKQDLVQPRLLGSVAAGIHRLNPTVAIVAAEALAAWFDATDAPAIGHDLADLQPQTSAPGHAIRSIVLRVESPRSWPQFAIWLSALVFRHGDRILRMKGLLHDQERDVWIAVHGVRRFLHPPEHLRLHRPVRDACLVFITENLDPALIERSYRRWVLSQDQGFLPPDDVAIQFASHTADPVINQGAVA